MIISRTPLRISLAGGGSDLPAYYTRRPGAVLSTAVNMFVYITVNRKFDDLIRISYSKSELVDSVDKVEHNIIREAMRLTGVERGVEIIYMADIPLGSAGIGLGSSSSLAVGVLHALYSFKGRHVSAERLASEACRIEIEILSHPIGKQDQYAAAYGGLNYIRFNPDETVFVEPVICHPKTKQMLNDKLMLFYTGISRYSTPILAEQQRCIDENICFADEMVACAEEMRDALNSGDFGAAGDLLHKGWMLKRKMANGISNPQIDSWYERALNAGAKGGKLLGAGGGGFLLFYCDEDRQNFVRDSLLELKEISFKLEPQGSRIIFVSD